MLFVVGWSAGQEPSARFKVTIKDGKAVIGEATLPLDPTPRIVSMHTGSNAFGLTVEGKRITCSPQGSIWSCIMVDGQINNPFNMFDGKTRRAGPLPASPTGRKRIGVETTWTHNGIQVTQTVETVPSKPSSKSAAGQKRLLDTCRMTYVLENKTAQPHKVAFKACIDILVNNNDGALFASPTTAPGKILNGVKLQGKELPEYLWVLEQPNLANPGFVATMTYKHARGEEPNKVVLANLGVVSNFQVWDVAAVPAGDSACALFWEDKELKPGQKREIVWGYGGGISTSPEAEGRLKIGVSGSFEPNKLFTIAAQVDDPLPDQALSLELPPGIERIEGREIQPVPLATETGSSLVLWKARVTRPGDYEIRVRSSTGTIQSKHVNIERQP